MTLDGQGCNFSLFFMSPKIKDDCKILGAKISVENRSTIPLFMASRENGQPPPITIVSNLNFGIKIDNKAP